MNIEKLIKTKKAKIAIIGLGYVGLPLVMEILRSGFTVTGIDVDVKKVARINRGKSPVLDVSDTNLKKAIKSGKFRATTDYSILSDSDVVSICVPTPLRKTKDPDISFIISAVNEIRKYIRKGQVIILESTTYPGTTRELIKPSLESGGLKTGKDFYLAFSPERIDPGNKQYNTKNTPKVVGGISDKCTRVAGLFYSQFIDNVMKVSGSDSAEMVKLLENTFRSVNIGLVNEMTLICEKLGINVWEVIDAAATKPFGFMPFYPGPGLGGHCIPIDPHYLSWKLKELNYNARFIELAGEVNSHMPEFVVSKIISSLNDKSKSVKGAKILVLGVSYKNDINDMRESPALDIIEILSRKGAKISYHDPYIPSFEIKGKSFKSKALTANLLKNSHCTVITTSHKCVDYGKVLKNATTIIDTRNALKGFKKNRKKIITL